MALIEVIEGTELTEYVVRLLNKNKIKTVIDFLQFDVGKLCKIINLTSKQINLLRDAIIKKHVPVLEKAGDEYRNILHRHLARTISTGIKSLDILLCGNLNYGQVVEVCGLPGIGKSLLCTTLAINFAQNHQMESIYIDTKKDFSASRVHRILTDRGCSTEDIGRIMQSIRVERVYSAVDVVQMLCNLLEFLKTNSKVKLLIIDSLPSIWFLFHGENSAKGVYLLNKIAILLRKLANEHKLVVFIVNILTQWIDYDLGGNNTNSDKIQSNVIKPALGKFWEAVPTTRLSMEDPVLCKNPKCSVCCVLCTTNNVLSDSFSVGERVNNQTEGMHNSRRLIKIVKSCLCKTGDHCLVNVNNSGIH